MDHQERLYSTHHDKYEFDYSVVSDWHHFLVLWQDLQKVDQELKGPYHVRSRARLEMKSE
jgi:hypothetical protein